MADIEKLSVYDTRIVQNRPRYKVDRGALSLTNAPFRAIANTASQMSFNVQCPSLNIFLDREVELSTGVQMQCNVSLPGAAIPVVVGANDPVMVFGRDCALPAFPVQSLFTTLSSTINDTTSTINLNDVLYEVLRMVDEKGNRAQRTCPTMLDKYQNYNDAVGANNNPLASYFDSTDADNMPNGAWGDVVFTDAAGADLVGPVGVYNDGVGIVSFTNGVPVLTDAGLYAGGGATGVYQQTYNMFYRYSSTEKLVLSPFIFNDMHGDETGLFGINNIQLVCNVGPANRNLRTAPLAAGAAMGRTISAVALNGTSPFVNPVVNVQFLTPSLSISLPPRSCVPFMQYPRYITSFQGLTLAPGAAQTLVSNTITLPSIPDMLMIYCRPAQYNLQNEANWYLPINNISINFDNFAGLLSSHTQEQLYGMSVENGVKQDWQDWSGSARVRTNDVTTQRTPNGAASSTRTNNVCTTGGMLVLKPGRDLTLQSGMASGLVGNYTLQFNVGVTNTSAFATQPQLFVIAVNSGFFETQQGSSRIVTGVLTEQDIISAPKVATRATLKRLVGSGWLTSLGTALNRVRSLAHSDGARLAKAGARMVGNRKVNKALDMAEAVGLGATGGGKGGMKDLL
tara:strand:- start:2297 stop:4171 length:1875 start_codon:yes stop_codon:yes gene_type:complete